MARMVNTTSRVPTLPGLPFYLVDFGHELQELIDVQPFLVSRVQVEVVEDSRPVAFLEVD